VPTPRTQIILLIASSLVVGGIAGVGITTYHFKKKQRMALAVRYLLDSRSSIEELELLGKDNIDEVKTRDEKSLAGYVLTAENLAQRDDKAGEVAREILRITAVHRSSPSYIKEEMSLRKSIAEFGANHLK